MSLDRAKEILAGTLSAHRYQHTLNVADLCQQMAVSYGIDREKAYVAGLLHDCAKHMSGEELVAVCRENDYEPDDIQLKAVQLLHSYAGAFVARAIFGVEDEYILNSISNHTCGRPDMSNLEMLVFCADYCEVGRLFEDAAVTREILGRSLTEATLHVLKNVIEYNKAKGVIIHPASILARDYYEKLLGKSIGGKEVE